MTARRRTLVLATAAAAAGVGVGRPAHAQGTFPSRPIRFIFPSTAGGVGANLMHVLAQKLGDKWKQPVIVEPKPGANTAIGTDFVAKAPPDGHTILLASSQHVILPNSMRNLPYDPIGDFAPVATVAQMQYLMAVNPRMPNTIADFVAQAKAKPGSISYGSGGVGGPAHLAAEQFQQQTGTKLLHVPYNNKGAAIVLADVMAGTIDLYFSPPGIGGHVKSGKLKALGVSGDRRSPALPDVPTFREGGLPNLDISAWYGVLAPVATPKAIVDRLTADFNEVVAMPDVQQKMAGLELAPFIRNASQYGALMKADLARYAKLIRDAGLNLGG